MNYHEITINGQQIKLIPLGDCACGCGGKTKVAPQTDRKRVVYQFENPFIMQLIISNYMISKGKNLDSL